MTLGFLDALRARYDGNDEACHFDRQIAMRQLNYD
jgi:hypothetical protein